MATEQKNSFVNNLFQFLFPVALILFVVAGALLLLKSRQGNPVDGRLDIPSAHQSTTGELGVGSVLPDIHLQVFGSKDTTTVSKLGNKVTMINFWATWCVACMVEMPSIVQLQHAYKDRGFGVVAVNLDDEPAQVVPQALKRLKIDFPVYQDVNSNLADLFNVQAIPLTVIIDSQRKILLIENGERDWNGDDIHALLEKWL